MIFFSEIALKSSKRPHLFNIFKTFCFLNRTLGLRKSFLNQTTYLLKNRDSFLNQAFLNRDSTVMICPFVQSIFKVSTLTQGT